MMQRAGRHGTQLGWLAGSAIVAALLAGPAQAQRIENATAVFATLDKVTAHISKMEVPLNTTAQFGSLKVTPRACYSRPPTEPPKTTGFIEVQEVQLDGHEKSIFTGWMFAESPGLNAVEHPVFDVWLTDCTQPVRPAAAAAVPGRDGRTAQPGAAAPAAAEEPPVRPRIRR